MFHALANDCESVDCRRSLLLDGVRGLLIAIMVVDHFHLIVGRPIGWDGSLITYIGYLTAAECFVFLSGIVTARSCMRTLVREGIGEVFRAGIRRSSTILCAYFVGTLGTAWIGSRIGVGPGDWGIWRTLFDQFGSRVSSEVFSLELRPMFFDILLVYAVFQVVAPLVVLEVRRKGSMWVLVVSGICWILDFQQTVDLGFVYRNDYLNIGGPAFPALSWQLLFVLGNVCGLSTKELHRTLSSSASRSVILLAVGVFALLANWWPGLIHFDDIVGSRSRVGIVRLLNLLAIAGLLWLTRMKAVGVVALFARAGSVSLCIFIAHVLALIVFVKMIHLVADNLEYGIVICDILLVCLVLVSGGVCQAIAAVMMKAKTRRATSG